MAVSFLLGASATANIRDRWSATPLDDCVRGGTLYHVFCAKLLKGWGGEMGVYKDTAAGAEFFERVEQCQMKQVTALMKTLIGHGVLDTNLKHVSDIEVAVSHDSCVHVIPKIQSIRATLAGGCSALETAQRMMHTTEQSLRQFLEALCRVRATKAGQNFLALRAENESKGSPREIGDPVSVQAELEMIFEALEGSDLEANLDPEMLLSAVVDDETYALYVEIDKLALDMERQNDQVTSRAKFGIEIEREWLLTFTQPPRSSTRGTRWSRSSWWPSCSTWTLSIR